MFSDGVDRAGDSTRNGPDCPGFQSAGRTAGRVGDGGARDLKSAADMARQLLEERASHRCNCDLVTKKGSPGGTGGRDTAGDSRGRRDQEGVLMQEEPREEGDGTSAGRGRTGTGQVEGRDNSSAESGDSMNETLPYHVHTVDRCPNGDAVVTFVPEPKANSQGHFIRLPVVVSKYWGPEEYQAKKPGRCVAKAIVSLGTLLLVAVICFLAGYFTVDFPNDESTTSYRKGPVRVEVESSLRQHYLTAYNDRNSQIYRDFSSNFTKAIDSVFAVSVLRGEYSHCTVDSLRRGSVIVEYAIELHGPPSHRLPPQGDPPEEDVESTTGQAVAAVLRDAATSGQLTSLNLDITSIKVTRVVFSLHESSTPAPSTLWPEWATVLKTEPGLINQRGCGMRPGDERLLSRIVGGTDAGPGRWPWLGSMQYWLGDELDHRCSASLLNPEWAITAAHCVDGGVGDIFDHIIFGDHDLEGSSPSRQRVDVERIMVHPGFSISRHENDLALLKLKERVRFDENVLPACVETEPFEAQRYQECYIAGWGHTEESGNISRILQEAEIPLISESLCFEQFQSLVPVIFSVITDNMICAGKATGGVDSCQSDSGGSLTCRGDDGSWRIVGLTSFGYGCGRPQLPGVYTRVSRYWDYISSVVRGEPAVTCQELTVPTCLRRLPYTKVFYSQTDLAPFLTLLPNVSVAGQPGSNLSTAAVATSSSRERMETLVCLATFASCEDGGEPSVVPCREFCQSAIDFTFAILARCERYPTGATKDSVYCRKGINADCGPTHLHPTTSNHSVITSPYLPGMYNERAVGCTWRVTGPPCTAVVFKFTRLKFPSTGRGKIISIGSGNDAKNRSSALFKLFGPAVPGPLIVRSSEAWLSFGSVSDLFDDLPEAFYFTVEVHAVDIHEQGLPDNICLSGLGDCTENEPCFPSRWRCDGITDCFDGVDEVNCTATTHHILMANTTDATTTVP